MDRQLLPPTQRPRSNRTHQLHRSGGEDAPPGPQGLLRPGARGGPRSAGPRRGQGSGRPPGWALSGPPARGRLPLTSLGGEPRACPRAAAAALRPDARRESGPRGRAAEAAAPTPERRAPAQPVSAQGSRWPRPPLPPSAPLPLSFLQPTPLPLRAAGKPVVTGVVSTLSRATPSSQRLRRYWRGRPTCVGVCLHSGGQFTAD